jgi:hypothetical protein
MPKMDVLKALDELKEAGVEERTARVMIRLVTDAVELQAATRSDLERECGVVRAEVTALGVDLRAEMADLRTEMLAMGADLRAGIAAQGADLRAEIAAQGVDLRAEIAAQGVDLRAEMTALGTGLRREMAELRDQMGARLLTVVGLHFGGTALLLGAFYALLR